MITTKNVSSEYEIKSLSDVSGFLQSKKYKTAKYKDFHISLPDKKHSLRNKTMELDVEALNIRTLPTIEGTIKQIIRKNKKLIIRFRVLDHIVIKKCSNSVQNWGQVVITIKFKKDLIDNLHGWCCTDYLKEIKR